MTKKSAIITGAAKRIGRSLALGLAESGFDIGLHYLNSEKEALETKAEVEKFGRSCVLLKADLANFNTPNIIKEAAEKLSNVELLINNASIFHQADFLHTNIELFQHNFAIHVQAPFFLTSEFARICKRGNVINIIDALIVRTDPEYFAYMLSKKTLFELTKLSAKSLGPDIRVNAIAPGSTAPPIDSGDPNYMQKRAKQVSLKMPGNPKYILQAVEFLLNNPFVTGECIFVDGGAHIEY